MSELPRRVVGGAMIVIGIDPGIGVGKPIALVTVDTDKLSVVYSVPFRKHYASDTLLEKYEEWLRWLGATIYRCRPGLVSIEDARGIGGKGSAHLQTLVTLLKEKAEGMRIPVILVNPQEAKAAVRKGNSSKEEIAQTIRALMDCSELPEGHDYTDAVAVALAGERKWHMEQLKRECE